MKIIKVISIDFFEWKIFLDILKKNRGPTIWYKVSKRKGEMGKKITSVVLTYLAM